MNKVFACLVFFKLHSEPVNARQLTQFSPPEINNILNLTHSTRSISAVAPCLLSSSLALAHPPSIPNETLTVAKNTNLPSPAPSSRPAHMFEGQRSDPQQIASIISFQHILVYDTMVFAPNHECAPSSPQLYIHTWYLRKGSTSLPFSTACLNRKEKQGNYDSILNSSPMNTMPRGCFLSPLLHLALARSAQDCLVSSTSPLRLASP